MPFQMPATIAYIFCAFFGFQVLIGLIKVKRLDERERLITGTAWKMSKQFPTLSLQPPRDLALPSHMDPIPWKL